MDCITPYANTSDAPPNAARLGSINIDGQRVMIDAPGAHPEIAERHSQRLRAPGRAAAARPWCRARTDAEMRQARLRAAMGVSAGANQSPRDCAAEQRAEVAADGHDPGVVRGLLRRQVLDAHQIGGRPICPQAVDRHAEHVGDISAHSLGSRSRPNECAAWPVSGRATGGIERAVASHTGIHARLSSPAA